MKSLISLSLLLLSVFVLQTSAQSLLVNGKIPEDLLITLKREGGWVGNYSDMTIAANGEIEYQTKNGLPVASLPDIVFINGKQIKKPKYLKPKLSEEKLKLLIAEFEKIQFFRFDKDFPKEETNEYSFVTDRQTEVISIRINGQTKEVSTYLGNGLKRTRILRDLAERIRGAGIWNYENGEIPQVFEIWYRITDTDKIERDFRIDGKGKIIERTFWEKSSESVPKIYSGVPYKTKTIGKFSKQQMTQLMEEFEKAIFSTFKYSILTKSSGCSNEAALNEHKRTHINVQINYVSQMYASLYKDCNPLLETDAAKFEYISGVIERLLEGFTDKKLK